MVALFVAGRAGAGKTAIGAGLGRLLTAKGWKTGFLDIRGAGEADAEFMKQVLKLPESAASLCPDSSDTGRLKDAYAQAAQSRDAVILEGGLENHDTGQSQLCYKTAATLGAKVIIVAAYDQEPAALAESARTFGGNLAGVLLNKVPASRLGRTQTPAGVKLLGELPEDRALAALTVGELAECVRGKILNNAEKAAELVENLMLGAMVVDSGAGYFGRKRNKAAIIRGDRPDMQLAALDTSTRCLVPVSYTHLRAHET